MQKITNCLWFDDKAEEAAKFYTSIFKSSKVGAITRFSEEAAAAANRPHGSVMTVAFELDGQEFVALNGGPVFQFSPAISLTVNCGDQAEVDHFWDKLSEGGETEVCGWLKDKYGVSWQVVPTVLNEMLEDKDKKRSERVMATLLKMTKLEIEPLKQAFNGG